jgi:agmatinase
MDKRFYSSTFFDSGNINLKEAKYIIHQIPYEKTTSFIKGTGNAPDEIIKNSFSLELFDIETKKNYKDEDFFTIEPLKLNNRETIKSSIDKIEKYVRQNYLKDKTNIFIGGEHTITYPITRGIKELGKDFSLIYFDAHYDLKNSYENSEYSHACVMRRVYENEIDILGIGIRAGDKEEYDFVRKNNIKIINSYDFNLSVMEEYIESMNKNIYISVDFDFFEPSFLPAVGTPETDGFDISVYKKILNLIKGKNIVGMDFVEFSPIKGFEQYSYIAASIIYKTISILT